MEQHDVELHALVCEIADLDGLDYGQALAKARHELEGVQQYADQWNRAAVVPSTHYLRALALIEHGATLTAEHVQQLIKHDHVVRYIWLHGTDVTPLMYEGTHIAYTSKKETLS